MAITEALTPVTDNIASATSDTLAYGSAVSAGALLLMGARVGDVDGVKTLTVSDSVNGAWTKAFGTFTAADATTELWYFQNSAAGTPTVTISFGGLAATIRWSIHAYSGLATSSVLDQANGTTGSGTPTSGYSITTTVANSLIFSIASFAFVNVLTAETNYTLRAEVPPPANTRYGVEHRIVSATGTYSGAFSFTGGGTWQAMVASFKEVTAAPSEPISRIYNRQIG